MSAPIWTSQNPDYMTPRQEAQFQREQEAKMNREEALLKALLEIADLLDQADDTPFGELPKLLDKMAKIAALALADGRKE